MTNGERPLPAGWKWAKLGDVCCVHPGQHILETDYNREGIGVGYLTGPADFGARYPTITKWTEKPKAWCEPGDVLVTVKGAGVGKSNLAPHVKVAIGRQLMAIRPIPEHVEQFFLWQLIVSRLLKLQSDALGSTVPGLGRDKIESLKVPLPPLSEQKRIAALLNEQMTVVERARAAAEAQLEAARALTAAYLRAFLENEEARRWPRVALGEISVIVGGVQKTPNRAPTKFHKPYLTVRNVQRGYLDLSHVERFEVTPDEFERCRLRSGDILIVEGNGSPEQIGRNALFEADGEDWIHQNHIIRVRMTTEHYNPRFVSWFLNSDAGKRQMIEKAKTTSGLYTLSAGKVATLAIPAPPVDVQWRIVGRVDDQVTVVKRLHAEAEQQLADITQLPAALLRSAFSGEL